MQLLQEHGAAQCVVAIGYERNMGSLKVQVGDYVLSEQDFTLYDRISGEIPLLPCSCCSPHIIPAVIKASDSCGLDSDATTTVCEKCGQKGRGVPKGRLFGGGIAFPQDLVDGGGNREPWVGFKRSVEQVDLMVDVFCKVNGYCYS